MRRFLTIGGFCLCMVATPAALAVPRDVQIRSINFATGIITLYNFGATDQPLDGFAFCTHDENEVRRYSSSTGFNGRTIEAGTYFFVHFNNDAPVSPDHINRTTLGTFATPLDNGAFGMGLYFPPVNFSNGNTIADHLQWSLNGIGDSSADERSDEAEAGGVWQDQTAWIATSASTTYIRLTDVTGGVLHSPANYVVSNAMPDCNLDGIDDFFNIADGDSFDLDADGVPDECQTPNCPEDLDHNGVIDITDLATLLANFGSINATAEQGDLDGDHDVDIVDLSSLLARFGQACD